MYQQSASTMFGMSFRKNPRDGQRRVFEKIIKTPDLKSLNVQLPTGYGKSFVSAGAYSILSNQNKVNRHLIVVPTTAQRDQFIKDGPNDLRDVCIKGSVKVCDIALNPTKALQAHRQNKSQVFVTTIQSLISNCNQIIIDLLSTGSWMVTVDEYHHYGFEKSWGKAIRSLPYSFLLSMSATPYRPTDDSAFGMPDITVSYVDAATKEKCLKELRGHSYSYKIDAILYDGNVVSYTTDELIEDAGSASPDQIQKHAIEKKMRWSPKYVSPLITYPIERMISDRLKTGYKLQAIVGAMCVSHAEMVCSQIKTLYPELEVEWVGTGNHGRHPDKNREIIERFCPEKDEHGNRNPTLDILVHVGIAGEGLDSVNVSEVVHLNKASFNNSNNQENGRAARYLPGIIGNINFDSSSDFTKMGYVGPAIMDAMDNNPPTQEDKETKDPGEYDPMPEEMVIQIWNMELENIDSGSPEVKRMAETLAYDVCPERYGFNDYQEDLENPNSKLYDDAIRICKEKRERECKEFNERSTVHQAKDQLNGAIRKVTGLVVQIIKGKQERFEKSLPGDIKRKINTRKKYCLGEVCNDVSVLKKHYNWLKELETSILDNKELPQWLML